MFEKFKEMRRKSGTLFIAQTRVFLWGNTETNDGKRSIFVIFKQGKISRKYK